MILPTLTHDILAMLTDDPELANTLLRERLPNGVLKVLTDDPIKLRDAGYIPKEHRGELSDWLFEARMKNGEIMLILLVADAATEENSEMPLIMLSAIIEVQRRYVTTEPSRVQGESLKLPKLFPVHMVTNRENAKPVPFLFETVMEGDDPNGMIMPADLTTLNIFIPDC